MARSLGQPSPTGMRADAGTALLELLGFADMVAAGQPPRPSQPLAFPALALLAKRGAGATLVRQP